MKETYRGFTIDDGNDHTGNWIAIDGIDYTKEWHNTEIENRFSFAKAWIDQQIREANAGLITGLSKGLSTETIESLTQEYESWNKVQGLSLGSADEHLHDESLSQSQRAWLRNFSQRWESVEQFESNTAHKVTQAFDQIVNIAWEGAKASDSGTLSEKHCYELIEEISKHITALKKILYTQATL